MLLLTRLRLISLIGKLKETKKTLMQEGSSITKISAMDMK